MQYRKHENATYTAVLLAFFTDLAAQGWTLNYADADSIGDGSLAAPTFSAVTLAADYVQNDVISSMVWTMPASGTLKRWAMQVNFLKFTNASTVISVTVGDAWDNGTSVTNPQAARFINGAGSTATQQLPNYHVSVYEHGFIFVFEDTSFEHLMMVDRQRTLGGQYTDALTVMASGGDGAFGFNSNESGTYKHSCYYPGSGDAGVSQSLVFATPASQTSLANITSLAAVGSLQGLPKGPFPTSGGVSGVPRLFMIMGSSDVASGALVSIDVGETEDKLYKCLNINAFSQGNLIIATQ